MIALGLTGFPLAHSLSPRIHQAALAYCGLAGSYALYPVQPQDARGLADLLSRVRSGELTGLNVTIPHKETILPLLDALAPDAANIGAVNTIFMRDGQLTGANTDASGFLSDLKRFLSPLNVPLKPERQALVLGAGGAARAVVYALLCDGWQVTLAARRAQQAQALADDLVGIGLPVGTIELTATAIAPLLSKLSLIVNATPLGMPPQTESSPWLEGLAFPLQAAVYDLVYQPRETMLVRQARAAGLPAESGLGMLLEQAALAFELWTGRTVPLEILHAALEEA